MGVKTITITEATTHPIKITVNTTVVKGYLTGHAIIRNEEDLNQLRDDLDNGAYADDEERLLRDLYERFDGFGEGDGFAQMLDPKSKAAPYLRSAAASAYFEQWTDARKGNSRTRRGR